MPGPLSGLRVLELTSVVLGPLACQMLGDLGADVVKVEPPGGDSNRRIGPSREPLMGVLFLTCNRNKRSVVLDLKSPDGRAACLRLAAGADVIVHNYRPDALLRLGLEYDAIRAINPGVVFCGTYGFGRSGPYANQPAYDDSIQAACGLAALSWIVDGEPRYVPTIVADKTTALAVVSAVTAALFHRERTGHGQEIEVPMFETMVAYVMAEHLYGLAFDPPRGAPGYPRVLSQHRRPYRTLDGYLAVLPYLDRHWQAFCDTAARPDLASDTRFATLADRSRHIDEVYAETAAIVATRTTAEWIARLGPLGVPVMAVNRLEDLVDDPHLVATRFWHVAEHPSEGALRFPGIPLGFSATPGAIERLPPRLGEHTVEVLREAGFSPEEIERLIASGLSNTTR